MERVDSNLAGVVKNWRESVLMWFLIYAECKVRSVEFVS